MEIKSKRGTGPLQCRIDIGSHTIIADEPQSVGGEDTGPDPHDLLAAALAACTSITVTMYARRKNFDLQDIEVNVTHGKQGSDYAEYAFTRRIRYIGNLSAEEKTRLTEIAEKCPVHKTLLGQIHIVTEAQ